MGWMTDELLFYGGICLAAAALILLIAYACVSRIMKKRLEERLNEEYGTETVKHSKSRASRTRP